MTDTVERLAFEPEKEATMETAEQGRLVLYRKYGTTEGCGDRTLYHRFDHASKRTEPMPLDGLCPNCGRKLKASFSDRLRCGDLWEQKFLVRGESPPYVVTYWHSKGYRPAWSVKQVNGIALGQGGTIWELKA